MQNALGSWQEISKNIPAISGGGGEKESAMSEKNDPNLEDQESVRDQPGKTKDQEEEKQKRSFRRFGN